MLKVKNVTLLSPPPQKKKKKKKKKKKSGNFDHGCKQKIELYRMKVILRR